MRYAIAVGITLGVLGAGAAVANVITDDVAPSPRSKEIAPDLSSLQITSSPGLGGGMGPITSFKLQGGGPALSGIMPSLPGVGPVGATEDQGQQVDPRTVPTPGALSLMAISAVTLLGRTRRASK